MECCLRHTARKKAFIIINNNSNECVRYGVNKLRLRLSNYPECQSGGSFCLEAVRLVLMNAVACAHALGFFLQNGTTRVLGGYACAE